MIVTISNVQEAEREAMHEERMKKI